MIPSTRIGIIARNVLEEGPQVFFFRLWKHGRLWWLQTIRYWEKLEQRVQAFWSVDRVGQWLELAHSNGLLIGPSQFLAFRAWSADHPDWQQTIMSWAESISCGRFSIFDQAYQFEWDDLPWHTDWRWPHTWLPAYFRTYSHYARDKDVAYDVKFPWELSRFSFLLPLTQAAAITGDLSWRRLIAQVVTDWELKNPTAHSVNWCAMECAMRGITLALVAQMLAADENTEPEHLAPLLRQITLQGEFLFRNIEFTKIRSNHYTANLTGLLVMGMTLKEVYQPAARWVRYAARRICPEIELQYCEDGVNFEKTTSYHRLVTELFLLDLLVLDTLAYPVSQTARDRIYQACEYTRCYTRPDGLASNWGDNDGAWLLVFDRHPLRDHRTLLGLGAAYFGNADFKAAAPQPSAAIPWLLGPKGVKCWKELEPSNDVNSISRLFEFGGMTVSRAGDHYLIADLGEVGTKGRGGHGHNDTFSFELCLCGRPVIVDSGSPTYTGDLAMHDRHRSAGYHNTVRIDEQEMARLLGTWRISDEAKPFDVQFRSTQAADIIEGDHRGYSRLKDPVVHRRVLTFYKATGRLVCNDMLRCNDEHHVEQFLHFSPSIKPTLGDGVLYAPLAADAVVVIRWSHSGCARLEESQVSETFAHTAENYRLVIENNISGNTELGFEISLETI